MPGKGGNQKDFTRPADRGDRWGGMHSNAKEGSGENYTTYSGFLKSPMKGAASGAVNAGATMKGKDRKKPKGPGPEHKRTKGKVVRRSK